MLERALERAPLDVRVAAEAARATRDARRDDASDEANVPEFAFDEARRRDDASSSSAWTTSESDEDDGSTSCESVSARDVPKWLARARDGGDDDDDDEDGEDGDAPPRTRNEIANDDGAVTPVAAIGSDEAIEAVGTGGVGGGTDDGGAEREGRRDARARDGSGRRRRDAGRGERAVHARSARVGSDRGGVWTGERAAVRAAVAGGGDGGDGGRGVRRRRAVEEDSKRREVV